MSEPRMWLGAGVLAAGLGAALATGAGVSSADVGDSGPGAHVQQPSSVRTHSTVRRAAAAKAATQTINVRTSGSSAQPSAAVTGKSVDAQQVTPITANAATQRPPGPIRAAVLAARSYIYGYPLMEYQRVRQTVGTVNTLYSLTSFANPDVAPIWQAIGGGKRPNVDTFYSLAELDLSQGPVVLSIPDMGSRYFSFQLTDPYTNTPAYIGSRTTGSGPGKYAITWTGGPQVDIPDAQTISVPYSSMMVLGRTLAGNAADQLQAIELMKKYSLTPTGGAVSPVIPIPRPGIGYLNAISAGMALNPPPAIDAPQLAAMAQIGVGAGLTVADAHLGLLSKIAVDLAVRATAALLPALTALSQHTTALQNGGWATPNPTIGNYGTDYLFRAGVAEAGLLANTPQEAVYSAGLLGRNLLQLRGWGNRPYVMHFAPGQAPPVDAFWSVTVYDSAGHLVPNAQHRYSVSSSRPDELVHRPDGSIDIIFSPRDPGDPGANWLKVPLLGRFSAYLRMYVPEQPILDGSWLPPAIVRTRR